MRQAEKEKKKFYFRIPFKPDSGKKIPKTIAKKLKKLKKPLSDNNFSQNGMRQAEKEKKKNFTPEFRSYLTQARKFRKKIAKKLKKLKKPLSDIIFCQNGMRQAEKEKKKILLPNFVQSRLGQENSEKNCKKIEKIKKTAFQY